jgi:hypothetical protein
LWHDQGLLHGLAIAHSLQERLRWSEYFCYLLPRATLSGANRVNFRELRTGEVRRIPLLGTWVNRAGALEDYTRGRIQSGNRYCFDGPTASFAGRARWDVQNGV